MMIQQKKCRGTGKAKGFGCKEMIDVRFRKYGLGTKCCYTKWLLSTPNGQEVLSKSKIVAKKKVEKENKKKDRQARENLIKYRPKLQTKVQEIVRLIDIGLPCLAKGHHPPRMHGGHVYARGGNASMALNLHNIHRQGAHSNHFQNDDGLLREGLVNEYGKPYMDFISNLRRTESLHYSNLEYKDFYQEACKIANELKKEGRNFTISERIEMRNRTNERLGIYEPEYCRFRG